MGTTGAVQQPRRTQARRLGSLSSLYASRRRWNRALASGRGLVSGCSLLAASWKALRISSWDASLGTPRAA
eukprot:CAMPEP_0182888116 /NCGR_PEP_ID=MMETSP0034_2-20130328/21237_1 /TAXON_ID=156128 /ORGANISM="Nephroselmis pyriformis, Strain CCMP717" /LENGTH=70 /DNA_ID=CAMNT_0025021525 /DNA_START=542 /DNA_END=750 /DNA_ORIENTATION=+